MTKEIKVLDAILCVNEGISQKSGKPYFIPFIKVDTEFGEVRVPLDTMHDPAGIVLNIVARKEVK